MIVQRFMVEERGVQLYTHFSHHIVDSNRNGVRYNGLNFSIIKDKDCNMTGVYVYAKDGPYCYDKMRHQSIVNIFEASKYKQIDVANEELKKMGHIHKCLLCGDKFINDVETHKTIYRLLLDKYNESKDFDDPRFLYEKLELLFITKVSEANLEPIWSNELERKLKLEKLRTKLMKRLEKRLSKKIKVGEDSPIEESDTEEEKVGFEGCFSYSDFLRHMKCENYEVLKYEAEAAKRNLLRRSVMKEFNLI
jgi:hypothetical protein